MNISEAKHVSTLVNKIEIKNISIESLKGLVKLTKEVQEEITNNMELQKKLFESYGVESDPQKGYVWEGHKDKEEITEKYKEVVTSEFKLKSGSFMSSEEFYKSCTNLSVGEIAFLSDYLVKEEKKKK